MSAFSSSVETPTDIALCAEEVGKLIGLLRGTDRYAEVSRPAGFWSRELLTPPSSTPPSSSTPAGETTDSSLSSSPSASFVIPSVVEKVASANTVSILVQLQQTLRNGSAVDVLQVLAPFMQVVIDPGLSGFVTAGALGSILRFLRLGSLRVFLHNRSAVNVTIDCVTRTKFTETDRDADETVLMRIIGIVQLVLSQSALEKGRVALGLQCIQTIWISDNHSAALRDSAREAVFAILVHVVQMEGGCDGYATTLMDNVCLNVELLSRQPAANFDSDKLSFFIDVLGVIARLQGAAELVPYQVMHALHFLLPPGPAAIQIDASSVGVLTRSSASALPLVTSLVGIANSLVRNTLANPSPTSAICLEALISSVYLRPLAPGMADLRLAGLGEVALAILSQGNKRAVTPGSVYVTLPPSAHPNALVACTLLECLLPLLREPGFFLTLWESFDCVWHRSEVGSLLVDCLVASALHAKVVALLPDVPEKGDGVSSVHDRDKVLKALLAFHSLASSPESHLDRDSLVPSYVECLAVEAMRDLLLSVGDSSVVESSASDQTPNQFLVRLASRDVGKQVRAKPKKAAELVTQFLTEYARDVNNPSPSIAWGLRLIPFIDFDSLGEFFGQPTDTSTGALAEFIRSLNLPAMDPEEALRACLQSFRLPGEAQQIDRIVKEIAYEYFRAHEVGSNYFASADAAYTFLFSVIMLNTDQHNPQVKRRMELRDFVRNNRKINEGNDIPEEVQARVFASIRNSQIATPKSASFFCAPLKGRWKDLFYLNKTGYVPGELRAPGRHSRIRILAAKGYDILLACSYILARDPNCHSKACEVLGLLAQQGLAAKEAHGDPIVAAIGMDAIAVLRRYALDSFATAAVSTLPPPARSFDSLKTLLRMNVAGDALLEALGCLLCYYSSYALLVPSGFQNVPSSWASILGLPALDISNGNPQNSSLGSLFRGLLNPLYESELPSIDDGYGHWEKPLSLVMDGDEGKGDALGSLVVTDDWRLCVLRTSFGEGSANAPSQVQLDKLAEVDIEKSSFLCGGEETSSSKSTALALMMLEGIVKGFGFLVWDGSDFWAKEFVRSTPWAALLVLKLFSANVDLIAAAPARDALLTILRNYSATVLSDTRGLKVVVFAAFSFAGILAQRDPTSEIVDPAWILPILDELQNLANSLLTLSPLVCMSIRTLLMEAPPTWLSRLGSPVWRELFRLVAAVCPKTGPVEVAKKICHETALILLLNRSALAAFAASQNGANDMNECVLAYEQIVGARGPGRVAKNLSDLACKLAGFTDNSSKSSSFSGIAWTAIVSRIMFRVIGVTKQKKLTGSELSDAVELLRMCLGDPRAAQILSPAQVGSTVEKCASALSAVVAVNTPPGALQAALSVFARFFLSCLDKLQQHPQFDHLWLMSLRVILLFIKRGHDDPSMEQLAEVTTETLRNALQVLLAGGLLEFPNVGPPDDCEDTKNDASPVWWKVTWEIVETFCPGMIQELRGVLTPPEDAPEDALEDAGEQEHSPTPSALTSAASV